MLSIPELSIHPTAIEYFWYNLPWAVPNFLTIFVGLAITTMGILAIKKTNDRPILYSFIVFAFSFTSLGFVLSTRAVLQDQSNILFWNRIGYVGFIFLSPAASFLTYYLTKRKYRILKITGLIALVTVAIALFGLLTNYDFSGKWFIYNFGKYPVAEFPIKLWGLFSAVNFLFVFGPVSIHYFIEHKSDFHVNKILIFGLLICGLLVVTNLPSLVGYPVFPLSSFAFIPLSILGYGIFRSDFLNINNLLFKQRGLFYFLSGFITTILLVIAFIVSFYLHPSIQLGAYIRPYFLVPLLSSVVAFALAIYIAGSNPDRKLNMLASISFCSLIT